MVRESTVLSDLYSNLLLTTTQSLQIPSTQWPCIRSSNSSWLQKVHLPRNGSKSKRSLGNFTVDQTKAICWLYLVIPWIFWYLCSSSPYSISSSSKQSNQVPLWNKGRLCSSFWISMRHIFINSSKNNYNKKVNTQKTKLRLWKSIKMENKKHKMTRPWNYGFGWFTPWCIVLLKLKMIWCIASICTSSSKASSHFSNRIRSQFINLGSCMIIFLTIWEWQNLETSK